MPKLIISLDTEDTITPEASDGVIHLMNLFEKHGFQGNFCLVADLARRWQRENRTDIVDRLVSKHIVAFHSTRHSVPPLDVQLVEGVDFWTGVQNIIDDEKAGYQFIEEYTGHKPTAYVIPGFDWSAQSVVAMKSLGLPLFVNEECLIGKPGLPVWMCDELIVNYDMGMDEYFDNPNWVSELKEHITQLIDSRKPEEYVIIYCHTNKLITSEFSDALNYLGGKYPPPENLLPGPLRTKEEVNEIVAGLDEVLEYIAQRKDVVPANYHDYYRDFYRPTDDKCSLEELVKLANKWVKIADNNDPQPLWDRMSPADLIATLAYNYTDDLKENYTIIRAIGPVSTPYVNTPGAITATRVPHLAQLVCEFLNKNGTLPSQIKLDGHPFGIHTIATILAKAFLAKVSGDYIDKFEWPQGNTLPPQGRLPFFANLKLSGTWPIFSDDFDDKEIVEILKLQSWSTAQALPK